MDKKTAEQLAEFVIEVCCVEGMRTRGGRYIRITDEARLKRMLTERIMEEMEGQ